MASIDRAKLRRLEAQLAGKEAMIDGVHRAYHGRTDGGNFLEGAHGIARDARFELHRRITDATRPLVGGPCFSLPQNTPVAEMLAVLEEEHARLKGMNQDQQRVRSVFVRDDAAVVRGDIAVAREALELHNQAVAMKAELDRLHAECAPLRQLVAACRKFTGEADSTLANLVYGA